MFFLWVPKVALSLARIKQRVASGGHDVPEEDVRRRFERSVQHFFGAYAQHIDDWFLFDNSDVQPHLVAQKSKDGLQVHDKDLFNRIQKGHDA